MSVSSFQQEAEGKMVVGGTMNTSRNSPGWEWQNKAFNGRVCRKQAEMLQRWRQWQGWQKGLPPPCLPHLRDG